MTKPNNTNPNNTNPYKTPSSVDSRRVVPRLLLRLGAVSAVAMSAVTLALVLWDAETEPHYGPYNPVDAAISLVGGGFGILFWLVWMLGLFWALVQRWISRWSWCLLIVVLFALCLNGLVVHCYLSDRQIWTEGLKMSP